MRLRFGPGNSRPWLLAAARSLTKEAGCISILLLCFAISPPAKAIPATCTASLGEITDTTSPVPYYGRPRQYQLKVNGVSTNQYREINLYHAGTRINAASTWVGRSGDNPICPDPYTCTIGAVCIPPGDYDLTAWVTCDGGIGQDDYFQMTVPIVVPELHATLEITSVTHLGGDQYRVDVEETLPVGLRPFPTTEWRVYRRLADGSFSSQPRTFQTSQVTAYPGDKVDAVWGTCGGDDPRTREVIVRSVFIPAPPSVEVAVLDGNGQRAVIGEPAEQPLRVKFTASDASFNLSALTATFEVVSIPAAATGYGVGSTDSSIGATYSVPVAPDGTASAVFVAGNKGGAYVVRVLSPLSLIGSEARFTTTALHPDSVAILKDTLDLADQADSYAVSAAAATKFHAAGLDAAGAKIGPMKCIWSVSASGNPSTRGDGTVSPISAARSMLFQPAKVGKLKLTAKPVLGQVQSENADLFITGLYASTGAFDPENPADELPYFVPGSRLDGTSVPLNAMPQRLTLHVLTGGSSHGYVTFQLEDVSAYPGVAMNWPINDPDTNPDMALESAGQQGPMIRVPFSGTGDTCVNLLVRDYGARARLRVAIESGKNIYALSALRIPSDVNGNGLPDAGWSALQNASTGASIHIADGAFSAVYDIDDNPTAAGQPAVGRVGDGLTTFEEYRGFVADSDHRRLNPHQKDVFIRRDIALAGLSGWLFRMPLTFAFVTADEVVGDFHPLINPNRAGIAGATAQHGIRIRARIPSPATLLLGQLYAGDVANALGYAFDLNDSLDPINLDLESPPGSPNETLVVEIYPASFENSAIEGGSDGLQTTAHGDDVMTNMGGQNIILTGPNAKLDTIPCNGTTPCNDRRTHIASTSCQVNDIVVLSASQVEDEKRSTVAHETGHALDIEHNVQPCTTSIMRRAPYLSQVNEFTPADVEQIRTHRKH